MAVVVFSEVIFRYVLLLPLFWTEEFARYCLVWSSLLGAGVALKRGQHIAVTYVAERFPPRLNALTAMLVDLSIGLLLLVILWGGIKLVVLTRHQFSPALRISMALPYMAIPIGSAIMLLHALASMWQRARAMTAGRQNDTR
jgi:TRAP-type C4-dicarboxylate transport system permease small subunit